MHRPVLCPGQILTSRQAAIQPAGAAGWCARCGFADAQPRVALLPQAPMNANATGGFLPDTISESALPEPAAMVQPSVPWPTLR